MELAAVGGVTGGPGQWLCQEVEEGFLSSLVVSAIDIDAGDAVKDTNVSRIWNGTFGHQNTTGF